MALTITLGYVHAVTQPAYGMYVTKGKVEMENSFRYGSIVTGEYFVDRK